MLGKEELAKLQIKQTNKNFQRPLFTNPWFDTVKNWHKKYLQVSSEQPIQQFDYLCNKDFSNISPNQQQKFWYQANPQLCKIWSKRFWLVFHPFWLVLVTKLESHVQMFCGFSQQGWRYLRGRVGPCPHDFW